MIIMKIFFAVLIVICIIFYIMYLWDFALVLLVTVSAIPVVMFITMLITKKNIDVEIAVPNDTVMKNEDFPIQIKITNKSIFPVGKAETFIDYSNIFSCEANTFSLLMPVQARNTHDISFRISSKYCGIVKINCAYINIYDPLKIFRFRVGKNVHTEISVMPEGYDINGYISSSDRVNDESNTFSEYKAGDDPSEIFDLRGYNQGDKLNRIHWKLSSKRDEFIVKDYSLPVDIPCMIFLDLKLPIYDTLMETLVSISQFMLENERSHSIVYYNSMANNFIEKHITNIDLLTETLYEIIRSAKENAVYQPPQNYIAENNLSLSTFVCVTSAPEPKLLEYMGDNIDADIKNAVVAVTSPEEVENITAGTSDVNIIPVLIGRITSIKDIEL